MVRSCMCAAVMGAVAFGGGGCAATPTQVVLVLDAQPCVRARAARASVVVTGIEGVGSTHEVTFQTADPSGTSWPLRVPLVPRDGDATRVWSVEVRLFESLVESTPPLAIHRARGGFASEQKREVFHCFASDCLVGAEGDPRACGVCASPDTCLTCASGSCVDPTVDVAAAGPGACPPALATETAGACAGDCDDDGDDLVDCADPDCAAGVNDSLQCCDGAVVDITTSVQHCGGCGRACGAGETCCSGACVSTNNDPENCRDCGRRCTAPNDTCCGGACVNVRRDRDHCGRCSISCAPGEDCNERDNIAPGGSELDLLGYCKCSSDAECRTTSWPSCLDDCPGFGSERHCRPMGSCT